MQENQNLRGKEVRPDLTISRIKKILDRYGFECTYKEAPPQLNGCYSSRVTLHGFGSNGKGYSPEFCMASAYAELLERMQNRAMNVKARHDSTYSCKMVSLFPSSDLEHDLPFCIQTLKEKIIESAVHLSREEAKKQVHDLILRLSTDGRYALRPFYSVESDREVLLPKSFLTLFTRTNGMAAGNTLEEALVQGLSEIFERYVVKRILFDALTPPQIPRSYLKQHHPEIESMIQRIEENPRYKVSVLDASLGKGLPCTGCIIHDQKSLTFGVSFAAHPDRQIALERCFSEAVQGWTLETFSTCSSVSFAPFNRNSWSNARNIFKTSKGAYPISLFGKQPSWAFHPQDEDGPKDNSSMLRGLVMLVKSLGSELFIQDASIMGFPAVYIYAPGISEIFPEDMKTLQEYVSGVEAQRLFTQIRDFTPEKAERLMNIALSRRNDQLENNLSSLTGTLFEDFVSDAVGGIDFLSAVCCYYLGRDRDALAILSSMPDSTYIRAVRYCIKAHQHGMSDAEIYDLMLTIADSETALQVIWQFEKRDLVLLRIYPHCIGNCSVCETPCGQRQIQKDYEFLLELEYTANLGCSAIRSLFTCNESDDPNDQALC